MMLLAVCAIAIHTWLRSSTQHGLVSREAATEQTARFEVDLNTAPWYEIAQLPGIGEVIARDIVRFRDQNGRIDSLAMLTQIKGISTEKIKDMEPFVKPLTKPLEVAGK